MGGYIVGIDRNQLSLIPVCLDEYVGPDHICRVINSFTQLLDIFELGFKYAEYKDTGRRPYDPRMMLNLYLYGYLHRIRSSRRLRDEARRNVEVMWLLEGLRPDDKTISNFRTDNTKALKDTFRTFVQMCRALGLYGEELVATDSVKFRADNSLKNHYNETVVNNELERLEKKINEYMALLEEGDKQDACEKEPSAEEIKAALDKLNEGKDEYKGLQARIAEEGEVSNEYIAALEEGDKQDGGEKEPSAEEIKAALEKLNERKDEYEGLKARIAEEGEISTVDPDARLMRSGGDCRKLDVGYNVHTVVDAKYHLIVDFEVTNNASDAGNLYELSERAKEILEVEELVNLADKGYYDGEDLAACELIGVSCLVAKKKPGGDVKESAFSRDSFSYDQEKNEYTCPCGNVMEYKRNQKKNGDKDYRVYANYGACRICPRKDECTKYAYREIWRLECQDIVDQVDERTRNEKELYGKRKEIVEHVFGTIKSVCGYKQYLSRGKPKVTAETALAYLAYNMRRVVNIFKESKIMPVFG